MSSPRRAITSFNFSRRVFVELDILMNPLTSESRSRQGGALNAERLAPIEAVVPAPLSTAGVGFGGKTSDKVPKDFRQGQCLFPSLTRYWDTSDFRKATDYADDQHRPSL
ncbi:hypothetical protein NPIL_334091 [Nephila pilipes]|uniref:Uncharacterized protein n=1 Tax=Nephila pilipes TaxID=299642 RepID=A0A8X6T5I8_NEPPI|nr:hypothetical protein NPIL_334091 [Nephila pilipes]